MYGRFSELYSKTEIEKYNLIRVDSTIIADTCNKLKEGIDQKSGKKLAKFSFSFDEILPSGVEVFTGQKYSSEESALPETILTLRSYLIFEIIEGLKKQIQENPEKARDLLTDIVDYNNLKHTFSSELGRVMSRFS